MLIRKIVGKLNRKLKGYKLVKPIYNVGKEQVAWFSNGRVDMYVITDGQKVIDVQID